MEQQDRRVKRTQRLLAEALIALTARKSYETITVREITEEADVGYTTFYRHYADKDALLQEVLNVVLEDLLRLLQPQPAAREPAEVGRLLFEYVGGQSETCRVLLGSQATTRFVSQIVRTATAAILANQARRADSIVSPAIAAHHIVSSTLALVGWWLEQAMPHPPELMGRIYAAMIFTPTQRLAFAGPDQPPPAE